MRPINFSLGRNLRDWLILLLPVILFPGSVLAATETATIFVTVVEPIALTNQGNMRFGDVVSGPDQGSVILTPDGNRVATGGTTIFAATTAGAPAVFDVQGQPNTVYAVTLPLSVTLTGRGNNRLVVDQFTSEPAISGVTDPGGRQNLFVGATLNVDRNQDSGVYSGIMSVTVSYN